MPTDSTNPKPVSWVSVAAVFAGFALFLLLVYLARGVRERAPVSA